MKKINRIKKVTTYNSKIDHKFIQYLFRNAPFSDLEIENTRKTEYENLFRAFEVFKLEILTKESIQAIHQVIAQTGISVNEELISRISAIYGKAKLIEKAIKLFLELIEGQYFLDKTYEMASLILNKILIDHQYCPVIFYPQTIERILHMSQNQESNEIIDQLIYSIFMNTYYHYNRKTSIKAQNDIFNVILEHEALLRDLYGITSIGLFGSFAREEQHEFSDIDIWIKCDSKLSKSDKYAIRSFLHTLLDLYVDLNVWRDEASETLFRDAITIF
jgi:hypothetical protein